MSKQLQTRHRSSNNKHHQICSKYKDTVPYNSHHFSPNYNSSHTHALLPKVCNSQDTQLQSECHLNTLGIATTVRTGPRKPLPILGHEPLQAEPSNDVFQENFSCLVLPVGTLCFKTFFANHTEPHWTILNHTEPYSTILNPKFGWELGWTTCLQRSLECPHSL